MDLSQHISMTASSYDQIVFPSIPLPHDVLFPFPSRWTTVLLLAVSQLLLLRSNNLQSLLLLSTARSEYFINLMQHFFAHVFVILNLVLFHALFYVHTHSYTGAPHNILS